MSKKKLNLSNWTYMGSEFTEMPDEYHGFVYLIMFDDGTKYIGKKNFKTNRKRRFGKKEIAQLKDKRLKRYEIVQKESDWKTYTSSNKIVNDKIANKEPFTRTILYFALNSKHLTYLEEYHLFKTHVLFNEEYLNDNIAGKFFTQDTERWGY